MRCDKCGSQLLELWSKDKRAVWLACPICDKPELDQLRKLEADVAISLTVLTGARQAAKKEMI